MIVKYHFVFADVGGGGGVCEDRQNVSPVKLLVCLSVAYRLRVLSVYYCGILLEGGGLFRESIRQIN